MSNRFARGFVAAAALAAAGASAQPYTGAGSLIATPERFNWSDAPSVGPGAKIALIEGPLNKPVPITFRLRLPANLKIAPHTHPGYERVTVLSGTLYFAQRRPV